MPAKHSPAYRARRKRMRDNRKQAARLDRIGYAGWLLRHREADPHCTCPDCIAAHFEPEEGEGAPC
jgi:hypothetical protein